jgi:hypothetical protein
MDSCFRRNDILCFISYIIGGLSNKNLCYALEIEFFNEKWRMKNVKS